jgi:hypothetical protein
MSSAAIFVMTSGVIHCGVPHRMIVLRVIVATLMAHVFPVLRLKPSVVPILNVRMDSFVLRRASVWASLDRLRMAATQTPRVRVVRSA